eukprot:170334-Chlamydomonas_euryale.AAC.1
MVFPVTYKVTKPPVPPAQLPRICLTGVKPKRDKHSQCVALMTELVPRWARCPQTGVGRMWDGRVFCPVSLRRHPHIASNTIAHEAPMTEPDAQTCVLFVNAGLMDNLLLNLRPEPLLKASTLDPV